MWWLSAMAFAGPALTIESTDWPQAEQAALKRAVDACAPAMHTGAFNVSSSGYEGERTVDVTAEDDATTPLQECLTAKLTAEKALQAAPESWSARVVMTLDPKVLATVKLPADAGRLLVEEGRKYTTEESAAAVAALHQAVAMCASDRRFLGAVELYNPFGPKQLSVFWAARPATAEGKAIVDCAKEKLQDAFWFSQVDKPLVMRVTPTRPPERAPVTVTPTGDAPPAALVELVRDAVSQCTTLHPLDGPYTRSFQPQNGQLLGMTVSMAEGQVMPSSEHGACVDLVPSDFPEKSAYTFGIGPAPKTP